MAGMGLLPCATLHISHNSTLNMENRENKKQNVRERETGRGRNTMYMEAHVLKHEKYTVTGYFD